MKFDWRSALGLLLGVGLLWWTLKDESLASIWGALRGSDLLLWIVATVVCTLIFPLRALRWRTILGPVAGRLPYGPLWRATAVGMMVNNVAPARAGEPARAYTLTREVPAIPFATAFASLVVDRVFDLIVLIPLTFAPLLDPHFPTNSVISASTLVAYARLSIVGAVVLLAALYALVFFPARLIGAFELATRRIAPSLERRGARALAAFSEGLSVLAHPARFAAVLAWTIAHWAVQTLSIWIGFRAMHIDAPATASLLLNGISSFASAFPSTPGFFGSFEYTSKLSLGVYGVPTTVATSWAIAYHILTFIPITVIGAIYAARIGFRLQDVGSRVEEGEAADAERADDGRHGRGAGAA